MEAQSAVSSARHDHDRNKTVAPPAEKSTRPPAGYELLSFVGRGSFADVWRVRHVRSGEIRAMKATRPEWRDRPAARRLIENEAEAGGKIQSPHVIRVLEAQTKVQMPYLILEWLAGSPLEQVLAEQERLPVHQALWIARQCAAGLCDLERAGFAHGDVKPANVFVCANGVVKLIDLGFVQALCEENPRTGRRSSEALTGTAEYLAPEALAGAGSNPVSRDMYSLGVTLFRMLTGQLPFVGESSSEVLISQRENRPPMLRRLRPDATQDLADLLRRLLAKQPIRRPTNLETLMRELVRLEIDAVRELSQAQLLG